MARRGTHYKRGPLDIDAGNWSIDGTAINSDVDATSLSNIGGLDIDLDTLTSTAAELNKIDGLTVNLANLTATPTELNLLDGATVNLANLTATPTELNILDGVTGVTAGNITNIGGLTVDLANLSATPTELNLVDGLTGLINAANTGEEINRGTIVGLTSSADVTHGCAATPTAIIFNLAHDTNAANALDGAETGVPVFFRWQATSSTVGRVYGFQHSGAVATHAADVYWIAIGDQV